jgi:FKBP-type peptidyl-prolyl cis-trans isomerase 2
MSRPIRRIRLADAQALAARNPETFEAPSLDLLRLHLEPGMQVKICDESERFWVTVDEVEGERVVGTIDNELQGGAGHGLTLGDRVEFELRHIYDLQFPESDG